MIRRLAILSLATALFCCGLPGHVFDLGGLSAAMAKNSGSGSDSSGSGSGSGDDDDDDDDDSSGSGSGGSGSGSSGSGSGGSGSSGSGSGGSGSSGSGSSGSGSSGSGSSGSGSSGSGSSGSGSSGSGSSGSGSSGSGSSGSGRIPVGSNGIQITYDDGSIDRILNGRYERIDRSGRVRENSRATGADQRRLGRLGDLDRRRPSNGVASVLRIENDGAAIRFSDSAGWTETLARGRYRLTDPRGNTVADRAIKPGDIARIRAFLGL